MQFDTYTTDSETQPQNDQHSWAKSLQPKQKRTKRFLNPDDETAHYFT